MNEEEKRAIEKIKEIIECFYYFPNPTSIELKDCDCSALETILNLIEKLQKENEEFKKLIVHKNEYTQKLEKDLFENASNYVIPIQKVKDKIERLSKIKGDFVTSIAVSERIKVLIELLESEEK